MPERDQDYEYRGMMASAWDLLRGDTSGWSDRPFYRDVIRESGDPVLAVGCGTGRLLLNYLAEGLDVDGVDNSPRDARSVPREGARARPRTARVRAADGSALPPRSLPHDPRTVELS